MQVGTLEKTLPCKLTREQVEERGQEMASLIQDIDGAKDIEKERKKAAKEVIETDEANVAKLAEEISTGMTRREVECEENRNEETGTMEIIRKDDSKYWPDKKKGNLVSSRPLKPAEQQISLITDHERGRDEGEEDGENPKFNPENAFDEVGDETTEAKA